MKNWWSGIKARGNRGRPARAPMIKIIYFFKRKPGMSVEAFQGHWRTTHAEKIVALPGIRRYVQNHVLPSAYRKGEPAFDGVAESWFDDTQVLSICGPTSKISSRATDLPPRSRPST